MKTIRWGIIATGNIASKFALALNYEASRSNSVRLAAVASRDAAKSARFAEQWGCARSYGSYAELFADPEVDAVYIATPNNLHVELSIAALKSGKAVLCEKPVSLDASSLLPVIETARQEKRFYMEAMWMKCNLSFQKAMSWIQEGKIGAPRYLRADFFLDSPFNPESRLYNPVLGGGALLDLGIYPVTCAHAAAGKIKPDAVSSIIKNAPTGVDSYNSSHLVWKSGFTADLSSSINLQGIKESRSAFIIGESGSIVLPYFWMAEEAILMGSDGAVLEHVKKPFECNGYEYEIREASLCIESGATESPVQTWADSIMVMEILDQIRTVAAYE